MASESNASAFSVGVVAAPESEVPLLDDADKDDADRQLRPLPPLPLLKPMTATVGNSSMGTSCRCRTIVSTKELDRQQPLQILWFSILVSVGGYFCPAGPVHFLPKILVAPNGIDTLIKIRMEEYDDLEAGPSNDGSLDLSHNTWGTFPPELVNFSKTLLHLNFKNNRIASIPQCISNLTLLQTLDISLNQIDYIDQGIGKCIRLRSLNLSSNKLKTLPTSLGDCVMLEKIVANKNELESVPESLVDLIAITLIDVRDNKLKSIPLGMCRVPTLKQFLCEGNVDLTIPATMTDNRDLLFHCLEVQLKYKEMITAKSNQRDELEVDADKLHDELNNAANCISELEKDISSLEWERPDVYIRRKERIVELVGYVSNKTVKYCQMAKDVVLKSWNDRRTHPSY